MQLSSSAMDDHSTQRIHQQTSSSSRKINTMPNSTKFTIITILIATTLNLLGFTLTSPLNPALGSHFHLPTGASFGSLTSAYPAGMLVGLITWPRLSDKLGRKKIMVVSLLGSGIGLSLQSLAVLKNKGFGVFLASRILTGVFSGSAPVAKAFLADIGDERENQLAMERASFENDNVDGDDANSNADSGSDSDPGITSVEEETGLVSKYLGWRDAASTLSYILGPALGGILYETVRCWGRKSHQIDSPMRWLNQGRNGVGALDGRARALALVIGISALGSLIASFIVMAFVKDFSKKVVDGVDVGADQANDTDNINANDMKTKSPNKLTHIDSQLEKMAEKEMDIISCPLGKNLWTGIATVCVISFLYHIADSTFFAFYPALLQSQMGFDARAIGMSLTGFACVSFLCSATSLSSKLIEKKGVVNACVIGLTAIGAGLFGLSASASSFVSLGVMKFLTFAAAGLYFAGVPLYGPTIPTMLLLCVPPYQRGAGKYNVRNLTNWIRNLSSFFSNKLLLFIVTVLGIDGIINTMARIVSPLIMGDLYRRLGASAAFGSASAAVFASSTIAVLRRFYVVRGQQSLAQEAKESQLS
jgi:MFS family permease